MTQACHEHAQKCESTSVHKNTDLPPTQRPIHDSHLCDAPSWLQVHALWASLKVMPARIVSYDPATHDANIVWFEQSEDFTSRRGLFHFLQANPRVDTARALCRWVSPVTSAQFAAFAIYTTLHQLREWTPIHDVAREQIELLCPEVRSAWHPNAKDVLPVDIPYRIKSPDWQLRVELAARTWQEIAQRFHVVRQPHW